MIAENAMPLMDSPRIVNPAGDVLNREFFFIKNAVKWSEAKTSDKFEIYDPLNKELIIKCNEPNIGGLTKMARFFGGHHDEGSAFELVAKNAISEQILFRVARKNATLSFEGPPITFFDQSDALVGHMKKKVWTFGLKYRVYNDQKEDLVELHFKSSWRLISIRVANTEIASLGRNHQPAFEDYFRELNCNYCLRIAPEVPANAPLRVILMGSAVAWRRINIRTKIPLPL